MAVTSDSTVGSSSGAMARGKCEKTCDLKRTKGAKKLITEVVVSSRATIFCLRDVIASNCINFAETDSFYTGHVDSCENLHSLLNALRAAGYKFGVHYSSTNGHGVYYFQNQRKDANVQIPFFGAIYEHLKNSNYECFHGSKRIEKPRDEVNNPKCDYSTGKKRRLRCKPSKKIGCPATMHVSQISVFPEYTIAKYNAHGSDEQTKLVKKLKADIAASKALNAQPGSQPLRHDRYIFRISKELVHNHPTIIYSLQEESKGTEEFNTKEESGETTNSAEPNENKQIEEIIHSSATDMKKVAEFREILEQMYNQTFLIGDNLIERIDVAKPLVMAAMVALAQGVPNTLEGMPTLDRKYEIPTRHHITDS